MMGYGLRQSAWESSCGQELREREDRRKGGFGEVAEVLRPLKEENQVYRQRAG
jgi:hypothetical protein